MRVRVGVATDVGRARQRNEDSYLAAAPLFAVADGMGGHRGGDVASSIAIEVLSRIPPSGGWEDVGEQIQEANRAILERSREDRRVEGMGTTLTAAYIDGDEAHLAHVGDSRAYLFRDGHLELLTSDHTLVHEMVLQGRMTEEEAEEHPQRNVLIRVLGMDDSVAVDQIRVPVREGDRLILCSDGLSSMVDDDAIGEMLSSVEDPQEAAQALVDLANRAGGLDNITAVVIDFASGEGFEGAGSQPGEDHGTATTGSDVAPGAVGQTVGGATKEGSPDGRQAGLGRGGERRHRWLAWAVAVVAVLAVAFVGFRLYLDTRWFVGVSNATVAVYRGVPVRVAGIRLFGLVDDTDIRIADAESLPGWGSRLDQGVTADSQERAQAIVAQIRADLRAQQQSTGGSAAGTASSP